uniref:Uncharacterized protein n=1 Tax=Trichogramma kaykai TaxID=54128 RepID=A0ABD2W363_9HYME
MRSLEVARNDDKGNFYFSLDIHIPNVGTYENMEFSTFSLKVVELEEKDKRTIHLLIFLFMQFLSRPDQSESSIK